MANPVGEFSLKHTGSIYRKTEDGGIATYVSWEGTATGFGQLFGTLQISSPLAEAGATSGSITWAGQAFLEDATTVGTLGEGTYQQVEGQHKWTISLEVEASNGDRIRTEGQIDLEALTYKGEIFESG